LPCTGSQQLFLAKQNHYIEADHSVRGFIMQNVKFEKQIVCTRKGCTEEQPSLKLKKTVPHGNKDVAYYVCKCGAKKQYENWH